MPTIDIFNGDADGICALHQLRLHDPRPEAMLVTGVKRDIRLLERVQAAEEHITVLDISLDRNRQDLERLLAAGCHVLYVDHHFAGTIPEHPGLRAHITASPQVCTSILVDTLIGGAHRSWAVTGAFGDNLDEVARRLGLDSGLSESQVDQLQELGILLNYNGYGESIEDLFYPPDTLYREVHHYSDPLLFASESLMLAELRRGYAEDMAQAKQQKPILLNAACRVFHFPDAPWARRVSGVFANTAARERPELAHALLGVNADQTIRISVRAPLDRPFGAVELCRQFPTGGGRAAAAGINRLPPEQIDLFLETFNKTFGNV